MASLDDIRKTFLEYFAADGHEIVPSAPLVPHNDPTLLFTNAGMVPFKNVFTGAEHRANPRATSSQKCVRAGGKHNDLDNVGFTARHHTFFEMLGNFSFGDYFKAHAIELAWKLVTGPFALPKDRLLVTVYAEDEEAFELWRKIAGLPEARILKIATADNFWSMGDTGPCGPCSEIFYDHGAHIPGGPPGTPEEDGDRFVEIWNLVFMQYDQTAEGRKDLPRPSIDTGMGLERIGAVMQGTHDNYETDVFRRLIGASVEVAAKPAEGEAGASHRVIADHLRASGFLIADGVLPSNEGRGYVLRRIMRRAMRHAHLLGAAEPLMWRLVPELVATMGGAYPELGRAEALVTETLKLEEERFRQMLDRGLKILDEAAEGLGSGAKLPGDVAFKLYDTYGFPVDLTEDHLRGRDIGVDMEGFEAAMERQRADARAHWAGSGEAATEAVWFSVHEQFGATEFLGYSGESGRGTLQAIVKDGVRTEVLEAGEAASLVFDQTPFYGESGGQVGDSGLVTTSAGARFRVEDTQKALGDLHIHVGTLETGALSIGDEAALEVDGDRRAQIRANHSATHLLHEALRRVLGPHVTQKGSLVNAERLRFDFSHAKAVTAEEAARIEAEVNALLRANEAVSTRVMAPEAAIEMGALALFGEKYGDEVRVLSMAPSNAAEGRDAFSVEFCGGTHVARLGDIALFKIVAESAVGAGVRRIEAVTGEAARSHYEAQERAARSAAAVLKTTPADLPERVQALVAERRQLERQLAQAKKALALGGGGGGGAGDAEAQDIAGLKVLAKLLDGVAPKDLRGLVDEAKKSLGSGVVAFVSVENGKAALVVGVTEDLTGRVSAVDLVRAGAAEVGGKGGGGRPDMAQAGGPNGARADAALAAITGQLATLEGAA